MTDTQVTTQSARKQYRCEWCWERIEAGATYKRWCSFYDGPATMRMHPECHGAMEVAIQDEGGFLEWTPGQERPVTPNAD